MENFIYHIPTKIAFGKGQIQRLKKELRFAGKITLKYCFPLVVEAPSIVQKQLPLVYFKKGMHGI